MRIVGGRAKGKKLGSRKGPKTRSISGRVKEAEPGLLAVIRVGKGTVTAETTRIAFTCALLKPFVIITRFCVVLSAIKLPTAN